MFLGTDPGAPGRLFLGLGYAVLIAASIVLHTIGHLLFGHWVGYPMQGNLLTATLPVNLYDGHRYPSRIHVIRSLGGPAMNLLVALVAIGLNRLAGVNQFLTFLAGVNLLFVLAALMPIPTMDGGVLVRELRNWRKASILA